MCGRNYNNNNNRNNGMNINASADGAIDNSSQNQNSDNRRRGQRNGRGPWRSGGRGNRIPPVNVEGPRSSGSGSIPQGQYLSKTASALTNDPLSEKAYFPGPSEEFRAMVTREKIYPSCTALPDLMEQSYNKIVSQSPSFGKTVPRSAYDYYVAVLASYRLLLLHQKGGGSVTADELNFLSQLENMNYTVPKSVALFLSGMGSTKAPKTRELEFAYDKPSLQMGVIGFRDGESINIPGYFGPIQTHSGFYASYPSTALYAQAIVMDLLRTENRNRPASWDLPDDFAYTNHPINLNCLGYRLAQHLTNENLRFFSDMGITPETLEFENDGLALNTNIMNAVHTKLVDIRMTLYPVSTFRTGSVGQALPAKLVAQSTTRALGAQWEATAAFEVPSTEGYLGASFLYMPNKECTSQAHLRSLIPVYFANNAHVPARAPM